MAEPTDPLGVLDVDPKKLDLIRQFFKEYTGDASALTKQLQAVGRELGLIVEKTTEGAKAEAEIRDMYKARAVAAGKINEVLSSNKQIRDEELKTEKDTLVQAEKSYIKSKERLALVKEELANQATLKKKVKKEAEEEVKLLRANMRISKEERKQRLKANTTRKNDRLRYLNSLGKEERKLEHIASISEGELAVAAGIVERREKINKGIGTSVGLLDSMLEKTGFFSEKWKAGPLGGIVEFLEAGGDIDDLFDELALKMDKINFKNLSANVLKAIVEETFKFMVQFDKLASSFRKNTGIIDRGFGGIEQRIVNVQRANLRMGISMDEAFASANSLTSGMAEFTSMTDKAQNKVLQVTAVMQEFGVSAQTTSEIFNTFSKGLGYNADELEKLGTQIMGIATSLKIPPQIIATEFNAASKDLMKYGGDMIKVFEGLAEQSKQTGIAVGELMGIVKQYDTFEGAGEAVGKLNAILGGPYLNSINMLYATEEERVKMMRESIQLSGRQFKDLSRFEQQAIASAAGISDMATASKLFGGTASEFANSRMEMKEMQEQAIKAQAVQEKFTQVMQSFAIALGPVVTILGGFLDAALVLMNPLGELARVVGLDDQSGLINGLGALTVAGYGYVAMMQLGLVPLLKKSVLPLLQKKIALLSTSQALVLGVVAGFALFTGLKSMFDDMTSGAAQLATGLVILAVALALVRAGMAASLTGPMAFFVYPVLAAAAIAGVYGVLTSIPKFEKGKQKGQQVSGGSGLVGENGEEMVIAGNGQTYMVNEPSVVELGTQDTVLTNAETRAAMAGGGTGSKELLPVLSALQTTLGALTTAISAANQPQNVQKDKKPVIIEMDHRKVAETTIEYIKKHSNLRLA